MRVTASAEAIALVQAGGGRLFVRARRARCCQGSLTLLETSNEPGNWSFRRVETTGIELYLDERLCDPDALEIDVGGRRRRHVRAYWNGCAYVV
jgi:hypothetical protein